MSTRRPTLRVDGTPFDAPRRAKFDSFKESFEWLIEEALKDTATPSKDWVKTLAHNCAYIAATDH